MKGICRAPGLEKVAVWIAKLIMVALLHCKFIAPTHLFMFLLQSFLIALSTSLLFLLCFLMHCWLVCIVFHYLCISSFQPDKEHCPLTVLKNIYLHSSITILPSIHVYSNLSHQMSLNHSVYFTCPLIQESL